jgi:hypothetical protein
LIDPTIDRRAPFTAIPTGSEIGMRRLIAAFVATILTAAIIVVETPQSASAAPCWTSFAPPAPQGGAMVHTFVNCGTSSVAIAPYYVLSGRYYVHVNECTGVAPGETWHWFYNSTVPNAMYSTANCALPSNPTPSPSIPVPPPCWTSFVPSAPQGNPMDQYYRNCSNNGVVVTPAYVYAGSLFVHHRSCQWMLPQPSGSGHESKRWHFDSTVPNVNYTTVNCLFFPTTG